ncbi:phosphate ABC transporter ATP-binding protein [Acaryochloris marina]|uniref:phosphate ABC transporter ATP-binding protein n=1 Tax=Acaryochloris marina TaxID=155978 RepID=UPI0021C2F716|nr:phosphate ABC transporter ATP-binding protein [Acaryochloris marina]BDM77479.1 phosphate ABC transporter ATP-binding protein [Acaryochloris marina MBIC10699]
MTSPTLSPLSLIADHHQPPSLRVEQLSLRYGRKVAFANVDAQFRAGQITALIGPSGCGKTSFLSCLNRLHELTPKAQLSGRVYLNKCDTATMPLTPLRRQVGMLFQKPNPFPLSIYRNLAFPLKEHGICDRTHIHHIIETTLTDVGLWAEVKDRLKAPALSLSGGQQQRLCLARALALKPQVLLMDEPCSALDPLSSEVIEDLILRLKGTYTILVVTHNLGQASRIADDVAFFWVQHDVGQLVEFGSAQEIFTQPQDPLTAAYVSGRRG